MKKLNNFSRLVAFVFIYTMGSLHTVYGDDTEIFVSRENVESVQPNILFIIDSSGSMGDGIPGDGLPDSKMEIVQDVMDDVLTSLVDVNVGLMRFNNGKPGAILQPILDIDLPAPNTAQQSIREGINDASQASATGFINMTSNSLTFNGSNDYVAVRFENLNIPQGARITSAQALLMSNVTMGIDGDSEIVITAEAADSAAIFDGSTNSFSTRDPANPTPGPQSVNWNPEAWLKGEIYATPDISSVVEEVIDRAGWCGGNSLVLFFRKGALGGSRSAYSQEGVEADFSLEGAYPPRIRVTYDATFEPGDSRCMTKEIITQVNRNSHDFEIRANGSATNSSDDLDFFTDTRGRDNDQRAVGMVFENVSVPQGANILYAYLSFKARRDSRDTTELVIKAVNRGDVASPTNYWGMYNDPQKTAGVNWTIPNNWENNSIYASPDIASIVNTVVSRGDWALNNSMAFILRGSQGRHAADSRDGGNSPKLHIGYTGPWVGGSTVRDSLKEAVQGLIPSGLTPISGTMEEAARYFTGDLVGHGASRNGNNLSRVSHFNSYDNTGVVSRDPLCTDANLDSASCASEVITGGPNYVSPVTASCQTNHIVYLTDGTANGHLESTNTTYAEWVARDDEVAELPATCESGPNVLGRFGESLGPAGDDCSIQITKWLHGENALPGLQPVTTNMIGFGNGADPVLMADMAEAGGGDVSSPETKEELIKVITDLLGGIETSNTTFVTSGVSVNQLNRLTHNDDLYYSLFSPKATTSWPGNIKRYRLLNGAIVDSENLSAVDPTNAQFRNSAKSIWSSDVDGNDVGLGGAVEQLDVARTVYSNISNAPLSSAPENAVRASNASITTELLGGVTSERRKDILHWAVGYDIHNPEYDSDDLSDTPARKDIGDPLHSRPTVVQYNDSNGDPLTTRILVSTNNGYLHSFDSSDGKESWAFIPKPLLARLDSVIDSDRGAHTYGLDGSITLSLFDENGNGAVDEGDDKVMLYVGQRRGGDHYYALDITNPNAPKMLFEITNEGPGTDFELLGQTWSTPTVARMNFPGMDLDKNPEQKVMIFGGGYDLNQDITGEAATRDTIGNIVYIVDAIDGSLLWKSTDAADPGGEAGSVTELNSVPSQVTAINLDDDPFIDHLYVSDTNAQIFRFDVVDGEEDGDGNVLLTSIKGGRIAHLNGNISINNRRFYYSPDVALIRNVNESFISVAIGSGHRASPLSKDVVDHFFVLQDKGVLAGTYDMDVDKINGLQDVTSLVDANSDGVSDAVQSLNDNPNKKGWYIHLDSLAGEKIIERSITFNNAVIFTSYVPAPEIITNCQPESGSGRIYALNILNGNPFVNLNEDGTLDKNDRYVDLVGGGIAPPPQIFLEGGDNGITPRLCVGTECGFDDILPPITDGLMGIKWRKNE